jgi:hypothetical protein
VADRDARPPRWDPDERGVGVGDARAFAAELDGDLPGETRFATQGHTLVLTIDEPGGPPSPAATG